MDFNAYEDTVTRKPLTLDEITHGLECLDGSPAATAARWGWTPAFVKAVATGKAPPPPVLEREIRDFVLPVATNYDVRRVFQMAHVKAIPFGAAWGCTEKQFRRIMSGETPVPPALTTYVAQLWAFLERWRPNPAQPNLPDHEQHEPGSVAWVRYGLDRLGIQPQALVTDWCYPQRTADAMLAGRLPLPPVLLGLVREEIPPVTVTHDEIRRIFDGLNISRAGVSSKDFGYSAEYITLSGQEGWRTRADVAAYINRLGAFYDAHPYRTLTLAQIRSGLRSMDPKQKAALVLKATKLRATRFEGDQPMSYEAIGERMGLSRERVRQLLLPGAPRTSRAGAKPPAEEG